MAQTGFTPIVTYNTATATTVPSAANLAQGELAVNVTDKKLYTKDSGGNVVLLASNGGDVTGPASSTNLAIPTFSGTGGKTLLDNSGATISAGVITATGFSGPLTGNVTGNVSGSSGSCTGNAATVTTNANLTGPITSVGNATSIASQTGTGTTFAMSASPTFTGTVGAADLTTTGNTILGNASTDTLNVGNGDLIKDASGNVGVGCSPNAKIHASTSAKFVGRFDSTDTSSNNVLISNVNNYNYGIFGCTSGNGTSTGDVYGVGYSASAGTLFTPVISYKSTKAVRFDGYGAGAITSDASGNLTAVSDEGVKKDIRPFTKGLAEIIAIAQDPKGVILYGYTKESGLDQTKNDYAGWSAQVVQQSIPEAVGKMQDEIDADGVLITEGCLTLNPFVIVAAQTNAINELNNTIEKLLKRIELLEQK